MELTTLRAVVGSLLPANSPHSFANLRIRLFKLVRSQQGSAQSSKIGQKPGVHGGIYAASNRERTGNRGAR